MGVGGYVLPGSRSEMGGHRAGEVRHGEQHPAHDAAHGVSVPVGQGEGDEGMARGRILDDHAAAGGEPVLREEGAGLVQRDELRDRFHCIVRSCACR